MIPIIPMKCWRTTFTVLAALLLSGVVYAQPISIFIANNIHFDQEDPGKYDTDSVKAEDNGRVIVRTVNLPENIESQKITAHLAVNPIPKDEVSVCDPWDRAGNVRIAVPGKPDCELIKFITAYGGRTEYNIDVTDLAPVLSGKVTFKAFIDTWLSPAWTVDLDLDYAPDSLARITEWVLPVIYVESFDRATYNDSGLTVSLEIPDRQQRRVLLHYYVSGHCTDGRDEDEFVKKDNVIAVDGNVVYRYQPWRDDCRQFRDINPYTRRWSDGYWSSDYSRSGWCPGDYVKPLELDLTDHLTPGRHSIHFMIENVRPKDENGQYGYWRVSAQLLGIAKTP